jgi:hypothetical protein
MLATLLPEIFPIILSHLPLCTQPSTLLALALTCRRLNNIIVPRLLYQHVRLRGQKRAIEVLRMLAAEQVQNMPAGQPALGHHIHRLFILAGLSDGARVSPLEVDSNMTTVNAITYLRALIDLRGLPNLISLTFHARPRPWYEDGFQPLLDPRRLDISFWRSLEKQCPRLTELSVTGLQNFEGDYWVQKSGLYEYRVCPNFCKRPSKTQLTSAYRDSRVFAFSTALLVSCHFTIL